MAELYPAPLAVLLRRMFRELELSGSIFDLPSKSFYRGDPGLDLSVRFLDQAASTPVGPAAGPQSQLAQNIVLSWLAGARIMELKTIQINDQLDIPRPCIYAGTVGYNVEWSQELRLADSLTEYVKASMLIDILKHSRLAGERPGPDLDDTILDLSVGYDLAGIRDEAVTGFIRRIRDAGPIVDRFRQELTGPFARFRDLPFRTRLIDSITLSTFHGCPANEIESIAEYLMEELGINTVVKLNPTLMGKEEVDRILHDVLGYDDIESPAEAYEKDTRWDQAQGFVRRLASRARALGRKFGIKFTNTLVVRNKGTYFADPQMYLSGPPLHVISTTTAWKFRQALGFDIPISFSAGIDRRNFTHAVAMGFTPITTCTDLLKTGGYARLVPYLTNLEKAMRERGVASIPAYVATAEGQGARAVDGVLASLPALATEFFETGLLPDPRGDEPAQGAPEELAGLSRALKDALPGGTGALAEAVASHGEALSSALAKAEKPLDEAQLGVVRESLPRWIERRSAILNMEPIVARTQEDPRYAHPKNRKDPRKIGSRLYLFDCINCDKCVPVCPNDANFGYEVEARRVDYADLQVGAGGQLVSLDPQVFELAKGHQLANYADFCNECGNCDTFCPEEGGPYVEKPRFFGSEETWRRHSDRDGFYIERREDHDRMLGRLEGKEYALSVCRRTGEATYDDGVLRVSLRGEDTEPTRYDPVSAPLPEGHVLAMGPYLVMRTVLEGVMSRDTVNYVSAAASCE